MYHFIFIFTRKFREYGIYVSQSKFTLVIIKKFPPHEVTVERIQLDKMYYVVYNMALGSTQPLTKMSTRCISWG